MGRRESLAAASVEGNAELMEPEYWRRLKNIFQAALAMEESDRNRVIEEACAGDANLASQVWALLGAHQQNDTFLETPAAELAGISARWEDIPLERLGAWKILDRIGHGGMADVYLVERCDGHFERRAALKVLRKGMFGDDVREYFARERQVLADLDHPGIVRLLDGGVTADHRPYLVMDFIDGVPITEYAQSLSRAERLRLFLRVCEAVRYAHEHGVVHRDLKPANILVTSEGIPRVLDFGIAKLLPPNSAGGGSGSRTETHSFTMEYASPEQVRGESVTLAADVHGLGLLLYEMLLGRPPFSVGSLPPYEAARVVCEQFPDLADLTPRLASIVGKAIRKKPAERYASVQEFAAAIQDDLNAPGRQGLTKRTVRRVLMATACLTLGLASAAALIYSPVRLWQSGRPPQPKLSQLTSHPGSVDQPDLSPDGSFLIYNRSLAGAYGIWLLSIQNGDWIRLTDAADCCARWSPDGKQIAFSRQADAYYHDVMLMDAKGGTPRKVSRILGMNLSWSTDGKSLAIVDKDSTNGPLRIVRLDLETGERRGLTNPPAGSWGDVELAFSPDGRNLAFVRYPSKGDGDLYVVPASGGSPTRLTNEHTWITGMAWTPDSKYIVFPAIRPKVKRTGLWCIPADATPGTEPDLVRGTGESEPRRPTIVRYGGGARLRLAFAGVSEHLRLWKGALSNGTQAPHARVGDWPGAEVQPAFAPDGKRIAFRSTRNGFQEIWVAGMDGAEPSRITDLHSLDVGWPKWSPDGSQICFVARLDGRRSVYVVSANGGNLRRVRNTEEDAAVPSWSRDGRWIYFRSSRSGVEQIWKVAATGEGEPVAVTKGGGVEAYESPDGKYVYFLRSHDRGRLWRVPAGSGVEEEVPHFPLLKSGYWALTDVGICLIDVYATNTDWHTFAVGLVPFGGLTMVTIGTLVAGQGDVEPGIAIRHDAGAIVWSRVEGASDEFLLDDVNVPPGRD